MKLLEACSEISIQMTGDLPGWSKPFARVVLYLMTILAALVLMPFVPWISRFQNKRTRAFTELKRALENKWYRESSQTALQELRNIYSRVRQISHPMEGIKVEPYGEFYFESYVEILNMLYNWEITHHNWEEARKVCDDILEHKLSREEPVHLEVYDEEWIVNKAKCIEKLEGKIHAQEFLLQCITPNRKDSPIKRYLQNLRKKS